MHKFQIQNGYEVLLWIRSMFRDFNVVTCMSVVMLFLSIWLLNYSVCTLNICWCCWCLFLCLIIYAWVFLNPLISLFSVKFTNMWTNSLKKKHLGLSLTCLIMFIKYIYFINYENKIALFFNLIKIISWKPIHYQDLTMSQ